MTVTAFDTLKMAGRLEAMGFSAAQAAGVAEVLVETVVADPATRSDLTKLETALRGDMVKLEAGLRGDMVKLETGLRGDMVKLETGLRGDMNVLRGDLVKLEAAMRGEMIAGFAMVKVDILRWLVPLLVGQMALTLGLFARLAG